MITIDKMVNQLKNHLRGTRSFFAEWRSLKDGCPTCGYDSTQVEALDFDKLMEEIDNFGKSLKEKHKGVVLP